MRHLFVASLTLVCLFGLYGVSSAKEKGAKGEHKSPEERFAALDTNSDGSLTLEEFKASKVGTRMKGKDGAALDKAEIEARQTKMFEKLDANHDGKVTLEEFKTGMAAIRAHHHAKSGDKPAEAKPTDSK